MFFERVQKFLANNYPDVSNNITNNEISLYMYGEAGVVIEDEANKKYQLEGIYPDQEGFITTYSFPASDFTYNWDTLEYAVTLPFPIVNLPLGVSIKSPYFTGGGGVSLPLFALHAYQRGYDNQLPSPDIGLVYYAENMTMTIRSPKIDLVSSGWTLKVPMLPNVS